MHDRASLLASIDEQACLQFLSAMVQHKSYSQSDGEKALACWMVERMREIGMDAAPSPVPGERYNAIGTWRGSGGGATLLFNGHLDTNPVSEGWTVEPWSGLVDDRFIYGIGVSNMKAGDAAYFCAVRTLIKAGVRLRGDVVLTFVVGELQSGIGTLAAIDHGLHADYFINSEPTDLAAMTTHAGSVKFAVELEGITRHLSKREDAVDAILAACELVPGLTQMTFGGARSEEHRRINRVHVGVIRGGLGRDFNEWRSPQVADFVRMKVAARHAPSQTVEDVLVGAQAALAALETKYPGLRATLHPENNAVPPFEVDTASPIVRTVNAAYREVRRVEQPTGIVLPFSYYGTDAAHLAQRLGMEGVVCGPGGRYNTMPDERVDIVDYLDAVRVYLLAILDICDRDAPA